MDPIANLKEQRKISREIISIIDSKTSDNGELPNEDAQQIADLANELAELVLALDEWRRSGGFDPYSA